MTGPSGKAETEHDSMLILGIMSGSSLDGIDLALCRFKGFDQDFKWELIDSESVAFSTSWVKKLRLLPSQSAIELTKADYEFAYLIGDLCKEFIADRKIDYIASHGHTLFHFPESASTCQIGNGAAIAAKCGVPVICDFRSSDIANGGQGAPIVSMFDKYVFKHINVMLNLGGIANMTLNDQDGVRAFDIGPCNQLLNYLSQQIALDFDAGGRVAAKGTIDPDLLNELKGNAFYDLEIPKSLDNNYVSNEFFAILERYDLEEKDKLRTCIELIVWSVNKAIIKHLKKNGKQQKLMISGGGAHNDFLVEELRKRVGKLEVILPDSHFIDFKEAIMMAFLGYLRINNRVNVLSEATGAAKDTIGGAIYLA